MPMHSTTTADADLLHIESFLPPAEATDTFMHLRDKIVWQQHVVTIFGRAVNAPRLSAWHGDSGASYTYSGLALEPLPWPALLTDLRRRVNEASDAPFNSALLNFYRDGSDSMGWHSDDEKELGSEPCIASLSLGAQRRFLLRHKTRKDLNTCEFLLGHGDLFIMRGRTQHYWKHQVPKTRRPTGERINITFRQIQLSEV